MLSYLLIKQGGGSTPIAELYRYVPLDGVDVFALLVWYESQFLIHGYVYHIWESLVLLPQRQQHMYDQEL